MTKLAILHPEGHDYQKALQPKFPEVIIHTAEDEPSLGGFADEMEIILTFRVSDGLLRKALRLRWIQSLGTGVDYIVNQPSLRKDILVTSTRGIHGPQMSEMAFLHMLSLARKFSEQVLNQTRAVWKAWPAGLLWKKKVGILGVGVIGEEIAKKAKAFGMTVYGIDIVKRPMDAVDSFFGPEEILKVASEVDFFILVAPNTPETTKIVNERTLSAMKPTAFLINIARGELVDEEALMKALESGTIAGAGLDAFCREPLPADHPFWKTKNVLITPHNGGMSDIYMEQALPIFEENLRRFLKGERENLINIVAH